MHLKINKNQRFSLIELICVMCVIMILIAISMRLYSNYIDSSKNAQTKALIAQLTSALQAYKIDQGYYPAGATSYPDPLASSGVPSENHFKFNYGIATSNKADTALTQYFDYQRLKGTGFIYSNASPSYEYIKDSWGNPLLYSNPGVFNDTMFDIGSLGKDGKYGDNSTSSSDYGKGDDITNFNQ